MSLVLALSSGIRASTSPGCTCAPGSTDRIASTESRKRASPPFDSLPTLPLASRMVIAGFRSRAARRRPPVDDHALGDAGRLVGRLLHGDAVDQILEGDLALDFGEDRTGVGIPLGDALAALDLVAVVDEDARAVGDAVRGALLAGLVEDQHRHVAAHDHQLAVGVAHHVAVADLDLALEATLPGTTGRPPAPCRRCGRCAW